MIIILTQDMQSITKSNNTTTTLEEEEQNQLSSYMMFKYSIRSELTRKYYERRLRTFFDFIQFEIEIKELEIRCNHFAERGKININWTLNHIIRFLQFQKERVENAEITAATLKNFVKSLKVFCDSADLDIPWKKITRGLPKGRQAANDRAPTQEEIQRLVEYPDRRIKAIVYTMASSGIRIGAWDYLQWKHITPISNNTTGEIITAKILVYSGDREEYYAFITPEAYNALKEWMDFRASYGEKITGESWVMRDIWQTTNINYGAKWGLATCPKKLQSSGIKRLLERGLFEEGIRQPLTNGAKRHEWKAAHGFRKFYKTRAEQAMKPINVEITMGHNFSLGVSASYYKPTEREVLEDYLKAVDLLTINGDKIILQKQVFELKEKSKDSEYIIRSKLEEKDIQLRDMQDQFTAMQSQMQVLISTLGTMDQSSKNELAKKMFQNGIYKPVVKGDELEASSVY
jgi:integrase